MKKSVIVILSITIGVLLLGKIYSYYGLSDIGEQFHIIDLGSDVDVFKNENDLIKGVVFVGPDLLDELKHFPLDDFKIEKSPFDCLTNKPNLNSLKLISPNKTICIRCRFDWLKFKYHIVGFTVVQK
ncbi:hypothetical protein [Brumimicrobium mesophilum]|uniref:hypothetical protein n=1 Tax=Brumimicrobium mesophilum TaxID=392717 RepID=UPI000D142185|nr:hypothetical protein [Brumimicrobium mesophilum]